MALRSTQPQTEMSTRNISWGGKGGWCIILTTLPLSCADCLDIWEPQSPGTLRACLDQYRDCFTALNITDISLVLNVLSVDPGYVAV